MQQLTTITPDVHLSQGQPVTTSMNVAAVFGKRHKDVLRSIRDTSIDSSFARRNFAPCSYKANNRKHPMVEITRDGFTLLAMGFTGRRAMQFKIAYIETFNQMQQSLGQQGDNMSLPAVPQQGMQEKRRMRLQGKLGSISAQLKQHKELLALYKDRCELLEMKLGAKA